MTHRLIAVAGRGHRVPDGARRHGRRGPPAGAGEAHAPARGAARRRGRHLRVVAELGGPSRRRQHLGRGRRRRCRALEPAPHLRRGGRRGRRRGHLRPGEPATAGAASGSGTRRPRPSRSRRGSTRGRASTGRRSRARGSSTAASGAMPTAHSCTTPPPERPSCSRPSRTGQFVVFPGQVSGNWAVWDVCRRVCNVYRRDIGAGTTTRIPNTLRGRYQYRPSVTADGTVYFVHSGQACGQNVRLVRQPLGGPQEVVLARTAAPAHHHRADPGAGRGVRRAGRRASPDGRNRPAATHRGHARSRVPGPDTIGRRCQRPPTAGFRGGCR